MATGDRHQLVLAKFHKSGAQEWACPTCGRRLLYRWHHSYEPVVLAPGDAQASHGEGNGERQRPATRLKHESGLSETWLSAIDDLDMSNLPGTRSGLFPG